MATDQSFFINFSFSMNKIGSNIHKFENVVY